MLPVLAGVGVIALLGTCIGLASKLIDERKANRKLYKDGYDKGWEDRKDFQENVMDGERFDKKE